MEDEIRRELVESVKKIIIDNLHVSSFHKLIKMLELRTGYSYEYIRKIFRESENTTPTQFYNIQKLDQCKKLLKETDYTILKIGKVLGFKYTTNFTKWFKQHTCMPPTEWRRKNQKV